MAASGWLNSTCDGLSVTRCSELWRVGSNTTSFVAGIDNLTLLLDPPVGLHRSAFFEACCKLQARAPWSRRCVQCRAVGMYHGGRSIVTAPCFIEPSHPPDSNLDMGTLLAAGVAWKAGPMAGMGRPRGARGS